MSKIPHADNHWNLQESLADLFRKRAEAKPRYGMILTEIALAGKYSSKGRLDVAVVTSSAGYRNIYLRGYEVKATRADLLQDLKADKWRKYLDVCTSFYFAFPKGMAEPDEIPEECGIIEWNGNSWNVTRKPPDLGDGKEGTNGPKRDTLMRILWRYANACRETEWKVDSLKRQLAQAHADYNRVEVELANLRQRVV